MYTALLAMPTSSRRLAPNGDRQASACHAGSAVVLDFSQIEAHVNQILRREWRKLTSNPETQAYYGAIFDHTVEEGFYCKPHRAKEPGEIPTQGPNEAYMQSHEKMWEAVDRYLESVDLQLEAGFRELFPSSREYEDSEAQHRRVFWGQLCNAAGQPVTAFMLTVPHSHECFRYFAPLEISLSNSSAFLNRFGHDATVQHRGEDPENEAAGRPRGQRPRR